MAREACAVCLFYRPDDQFQRVQNNPWHVCNRCCLDFGSVLSRPSGGSEMDRWCPKTAGGVDEMVVACRRAEAHVTAHLTAEQEREAERAAQRQERTARDRAAAAALVESHRRRGPEASLTDTERGYPRAGRSALWRPAAHWGRCGEVAFWRDERMLTDAAEGEAASLCSSYCCSCCAAERVQYYPNGLADSVAMGWMVCELCLPDDE
jgi:hypothetical protein